MAKTPQWVTDTLTKAWEAHGEGAPLPELTWRRGRTKPLWSSGHAYPSERRIVVTAGIKAPRWEQKTVLLHEIAHLLSPNHHHDDTFWITAWTLFREFGLPVRSVLKRETDYRKGAYIGYVATRMRES